MITKNYDNVDAMINSIQSNSRLINSMMKKVNDNDMQINKKMHSYASAKGVFSKDQMELYKGYVENKEDVESVFLTYSKEVESIGGMKMLCTEIGNDNSLVESIHTIFSKINTMQIKIMEMLCGMLGRANALLSAI